MNNSPFNDPDRSQPNSTPSERAPSARDILRANEQLNKQSNSKLVPPIAGLQAISGYKPSGRFGSAALPLLLLTLLVVPIVASFFYQNLWHFGGVLALSTIGLGLLVGAPFLGAVRLGKCRNPLLATLCGGLAGILTFALCLGLEAWSYRADYISHYAPQVAKMKKISQSQARQEVEAFLTPAKMTKIYWLDYAATGMTVSDNGNMTNLSGGVFWALEALDLVILACFPALIARTAASKRFSEETNRWFISKTIYGVLPVHVPALVEAANRGDWTEFARIARASTAQHRDDKRFRAPVSVYYVPEKPGAILSLQAVVNSKKSLQTVWERELSNAQIKQIWPGFPMPNTAEQPFATN